MRRPTALLLASLLAVVLLPVAVEPQGRQDDFTFFETVDVNVVNIEVVVTGPDGAPVRGLTRQDFELFEDGEPVEITNFYSIDAPPPATPDPAAVIEARNRVAPADQQLHLAIFVDGMSLEPTNRRKALDSISDFFNYQGARPTSLTLATFNGNLTVKSMPRFNPDELDDHLETLKRAATRGSLQELDRRSLLREISEANVTIGQAGGVVDDFAGPSEAARVLTAVAIYAQQRYEETRLSAGALRSIVEALAGLPGRKALLYVSGGLSRNPGEAMYHAWENKFSDFARTLGVNIYARAREFDTTPEILDLIRFANSNRVTFYSIGAGRSGFAAGISGEDRGFDSASIGAAGGGRIWNASTESVDSSNLSGTLEQLAAATGGLSMTHSRNFDALLSNMNRDLGAYYSLGYTPDRERDDKVHQLSARIKGADLTVRHRETYREQTLEEVMSGRTRSAVLLGTYENPLEVAMEFGRIARREKKSFLVPVMVKVPLSNLVLVPQGGEHIGRIGIFICTRDGRGRTSPVKAIAVPIRIPSDQLQTALGQVAGYRMMLQMRPEEHAVAVAVRDELGRTESTISDVWDPTTPAS
jgi:VWFA-related protein